KTAAFGSSAYLYLIRAPQVAHAVRHALTAHARVLLLAPARTILIEHRRVLEDALADRVRHVGRIGAVARDILHAGRARERRLELGGVPLERVTRRIDRGAVARDRRYRLHLAAWQDERERARAIAAVRHESRLERLRDEPSAAVVLGAACRRAHL